MSEWLSERKKMCALAEAQNMVRLMAEPRPAGSDSAKAAIGRASRRLGWSFNRVRDIWYGDTRISVRAEEMDQLRAALGEQRRRAEEKAASDELRELRARIDRLERLLAASYAHESGEARNPSRHPNGHLHVPSREADCPVD